MTNQAAVDHDYFYPNKMARILLLSLEEVLGRNGVKAVLNLSDLHHLIPAYPANTFDLNFPFDHIGAIHQALDSLYGPHSGRGLALRAGRACFKHGLREFGSALGVSDLAFRLLPLKLKMKTGADAFADLFNRYSDQIVQVEETSDAYLWHIERCPLCWGRTCSEPCCHMAVGVLQEAIYWVSAGKHYLVEEIACIARGDDTCTIQIGRKPLD
jgi:predicted hydrocarbon binding protein